jgi:hypothetical protein
MFRALGISEMAAHLKSRGTPTLPIPFAARVSRPDHVLVREIEGELILLNLNNACYYGLDEVGTHMWTHLITSDSVQAAFEALSAGYAAEPAEIRKELEELLAKLCNNDLIEVHVG